jgi:hypothetical protein
MIRESLYSVILSFSRLFKSDDTMFRIGMPHTINRVIFILHVAARIRRPNSSVADGKEYRWRTQRQFVHPAAIFEAAIFVPPSTLVFGPVLAATVAEQERMLVVVEFHLVVAPPAQWVQW